MAKPGRPHKTIPTVPWRVHIPVDIAAEVELLCIDPVTQKVQYGKRAEFIEAACREYLERLRIPQEDPQ